MTKSPVLYTAVKDNKLGKKHPGAYSSSIRLVFPSLIGHCPCISFEAEISRRAWIGFRTYLDIFRLHDRQGCLRPVEIRTETSHPVESFGVMSVCVRYFYFRRDKIVHVSHSRRIWVPPERHLVLERASLRAAG